ncbi:MAG: MarR family transcriptional regulator [Bacteroidota bacterium]
MTIESDIQQSQFDNEYQKALINLIYTHNYVVDRMSTVFKAYDITRQQYNVLRILRGQHPQPVTINLIRDRMLEKMSDASRIVERLRIKGLIDRNKSATDKRTVEINISKKGLQLLANADEHVKSFELIFGNLSEGEAVQLNSLLDKVRKSI